MLQVEIEARKDHSVHGLVRACLDNPSPAAVQPLLKSNPVRAE